MGLFLNGSTVSGTPNMSGAATSVTFKVAETGSPTNFAFINTTFPAVDSGGGSPTITFATAEGQLGPSVSESETLSLPSISASASNSAPITYSFVTTSSESGVGFPASMTLTGNQISGIAPKLLNAATYTFTVTASAGAVTATESFTLYVLAAAVCTSPANNICN